MQAHVLAGMLRGVEGFSHDSETAETLRGAVALGSTGKFDVVLLDLGLPDSEGIGTLQSFTKSCPHLATVVLTASDDQTLAMDSVFAGAQSYLVKGSFDKATLVRTVRQAYERNRAESALRESEEHWRDTFRSIGEAIAIIARDGTIVRCNDAMVSITGLSASEVIGSRCFEIMHDSDEPFDRCPLVRCCGSARRESTELEFRGKWFRVVVGPIIDEDGVITGAVHVMTDITEARAAEQRIRESEQRFRTLWNTVDVGVVLVDPASRMIVDANEAALAMLKAGIEEVLGQASDRFLTLENAVLGDATGETPLVRAEGEIIRTDGVKVPVLKSASRMNLLGKSLLLESFVDISEQKRVQAALRDSEMQLRQTQKLQAVGVLAGGIAHDFNNILGAIIGYSELVLGKLAPGSRDHKNLEQVVIAGRRAADLVRQILAFSRQTPSEKRPLDIRHVLNEALKLLRATTPTTIAFEQELAHECGLVLADPTQMHQVFMNLCTNAVHAMRGSHGILSVELARVELGPGFDAVSLSPGSYVRMRVSDTGVGMGPEVSEHIFEPFFTTKAPGEGTGMGLAVVHGIVGDHGGAVTVASEPGKGSRFDVYLPVSEDQAQPEAGLMSESPRGRDERVLFVDDEQTLCELSVEILRELGYRASAFSDSRAALKTFEKDPAAFDIVVTDMTMPGLTGMQLAQRCLAIRPDLPVVLCTGYSDVVTPERARAAGIRRFAAKPLGPSELGAMVREALDAGKGDATC
jgi:PAS domain S-box-containing protein